MKRKKKLKAEIQTSHRLANQLNMDFTQNILSKYGVSKLKSKFSTLIFRQYRSMLFNHTSKAIDTINTKSNKELPVPFNILRITQWNRYDSKLKQESEPLDWPRRAQKKQQVSNAIGITNKIAVFNLFKHIYEKYNKTLLKEVAHDFKFSYFLSGSNGQNGRKEAETKEIKLQQRQTFIGRLNKAHKIAAEPKALLLKSQIDLNQLKTIESQGQFKNKQQLSSFIKSQRQGVDLLYDKSPQSSLNALTQDFTKTFTFEQQSLRNRAINVNTNGTTNRISDDITNGTNNKIYNGITDITTNRPSNRINDIVEKSVLNNRGLQLPVRESTKINTVPQAEKKLKVLKTIQDVEERPLENEQMSENRKDDFQQRELILNTAVAKKGFTPKTNGFLKRALVQADGAISRILNNLSKKQNTDNFKNGFSTNNIYHSSPELIQAEVKQDRQTRGASKTIEKQGIKKQKHEDSNLILCKPNMTETSVETGQVPKDVLISNKEVYAKATTSSKSHKNNNDIDTEEVNLLAERILKVLEKRMSIQKDRRGLR